MKRYLLLFIPLFIISTYVYVNPACTTIDPAGCRPRADADPFGEDKPKIHTISRQGIPAEVIFGDPKCQTDTCGKNPEQSK